MLIFVGLSYIAHCPDSTSSIFYYVSNIMMCDFYFSTTICISRLCFCLIRIHFHVEAVFVINFMHTTVHSHSSLPAGNAVSPAYSGVYIL